MSYLGNKQTMTADQAHDLQAVLDGVMDRFIDLSGALPNLTAGDRTITALGNLIERLTVTALMRLDTLSEVDLATAYEAVTLCTVHSAVAHIANMDGIARPHFAVIAAKGLSQGLNRGRAEPCDCPQCRSKRSTERGAH